jgi:hypothetical protein
MGRHDTGNPFSGFCPMTTVLPAPENSGRTRWPAAALLMVVLLGLAARLAAATLGHNYDMESWYLVAKVAQQGGNVYAETDRYNYGPVWFQIVHGLDVLAGHRPEVLRFLIAGFLSLVDAGLFWLLCRRAGRLAGILFFLNPVSILITGFHCQFDNLAILLALGAILCFGEDYDQPLNRRKLGALGLLGLSLMTKHIFFLFPFWLAVKQSGLRQKILVLVVPAAVFLLGFAPYWAGGRAGIVDHVFCYPSAQNGYFYKLVVPQFIQFACNRNTLWYGLLILFAFICRARNGFESLLIYSGALVAFAPSTTNQYLAIPIALAAVFPSVPFAAYTVISVVHLCVDMRGLQLSHGPAWSCDDEAILCLTGALAWLLWRPQAIQLLRAALREVAIQFGRGK